MEEKLTGEKEAEDNEDLEIEFDESGMLLSLECGKDYSIYYDEEQEKFPLLGLAYREWDSDLIKKILENGVDCNCKEYDEVITRFSTEGSYQHICEKAHFVGSHYFMAVELLLAYKNGQDYKNIFEFDAAIGKSIKDIKAIYSSDLKRDVEIGKLNFRPEDKICLETDEHILVVEYSNIYVAPSSLLDYDKAVSIIEFIPETNNRIIKNIEFSTTEIQEGNLDIILPNIHIYLDSHLIISFIREKCTCYIFSNR